MSNSASTAAAAPPVGAALPAAAAAQHASSSSSSLCLPAPPLSYVGPASHALPCPTGSLADQAAHPLGILALFDQATTGIAPKLVAGGLSCMLISGILNPMDVIKVRLQTQEPPPALAKYTGFTQAFRTILAEEGYRRGLMRGFTASMLREASYSSLRMGLYDMIKICLAPPNTGKDDFTLVQKIAAGCISGATGSVVATPTDLVKIRFQAYNNTNNVNPYSNSFEAFVDIWKKGGLKGLYSGATPTVARAAILTGSQLSSYDHSKRLMLRSGWFRDTPSTHLLASIISGLVTCTAVNPADVIKTRIMCDADRSLYKNPVDCAIKTMRQEGPGAFSQWRQSTQGWLRYCAECGLASAASCSAVGAHCCFTLLPLSVLASALPCAFQ